MDPEELLAIARDLVDKGRQNGVILRILGSPYVSTVTHVPINPMIEMAGIRRSEIERGRWRRFRV